MTELQSFKNKDFSVTVNERMHGIEVRFENKMTDEQVAEIKDAGFKWSRRQQLWYAYQNEKSIAYAKSLKNHQDAAVSNKPMKILSVSQVEDVVKEITVNELAELIRQRAELDRKIAEIKEVVTNEGNKIDVSTQEAKDLVFEMNSVEKTEFSLPEEDVLIEAENGEMMTPEQLKAWNEEQEMQEEIDDLAEGKQFAIQALAEEERNENKKEPVELTTEDLDIAKNFIPSMEYATVLDNATHGEETEFFKSKIKHVADMGRTLFENRNGKSYNKENSQHDKGFVHYFIENSDWYVCEVDENNVGFGYAILNGDTQNAEYGYIDLNEITTLNIQGFIQTELDFYIDDSVSMERAIVEKYPELESELLPEEYFAEFKSENEAEQNVSTEEQNIPPLTVEQMIENVNGLDAYGNKLEIEEKNEQSLKEFMRERFGNDELFEKSVSAIKNVANAELNNPENMEGGAYYDQNDYKDTKEYKERLESLLNSDEDIKKELQWKKENERKAEEVHQSVVEHHKEEAEKLNTPQNGDLLSYNETHPVYTVKNESTKRETTIQPDGRLSENIKILGGLKNLTEAENAIAKIKEKGFEIYSTPSRAIIFNKDVYYDFDEFAYSSNWNMQTEMYEYDLKSPKLNEWDFRDFIKKDFKITKEMKRFSEYIEGSESQNIPENTVDLTDVFDKNLKDQKEIVKYIKSIDWNKEVSEYVATELLKELDVDSEIEVENLRDFLARPMKDLTDGVKITERMNEIKKKEFIDSHFETKYNPNIGNELNLLTRNDIETPNAVINIAKETPYVFQKLGLPNREVEIYKDKIARALLVSPDEKIRHGHSDTVNEETAEKLFKNLGEPFYVFKSKDGESLIGLYDIALDKNKPIMASLKLQLDKNNVEVNFISSVYGRPESQYEKWAEENNALLIYADDTKKANELTFMLQSRIKANSSAYNDKILYKSELVNELSEEYQNLREIQKQVVPNEARPAQINDKLKLNLESLFNSLPDHETNSNGKGLGSEAAELSYDGIKVVKVELPNERGHVYALVDKNEKPLCYPFEEVEVQRIQDNQITLRVADNSRDSFVIDMTDFQLATGTFDFAKHVDAPEFTKEARIARNMLAATERNSALENEISDPIEILEELHNTTLSEPQNEADIEAEKQNEEAYIQNELDKLVESMDANGGMSEAAMEADYDSQNRDQKIEEEPEEQLALFYDTDKNPHYPTDLYEVIEKFNEIAPEKWNLAQEEKVAVAHLIDLAQMKDGDKDKSIESLNAYLLSEEYEREEENYAKILTPILLSKNENSFSFAFSTDDIQGGQEKAASEQTEEKPIQKGEIKSILDNDFTGNNKVLAEKFRNKLVAAGVVKAEEKFVLVNELEAHAKGTQVNYVSRNDFVILNIPVKNGEQTEYVPTKYYHVSALEEPQKVEQKAANEQAKSDEVKTTFVYGETKLPEFAMITQNGLRNFKDMVIESHDERSDTYILTSEDKSQSVSVTGKTFAELTSQTFQEKAKNYDENTKNFDKRTETQYKDFFETRRNSANNFRHNLAVMCRKEANSPLDSLKVAQNIISQMPDAEKKKTKDLLKLLSKNGQSRNEVIIDTYHDAVKETPLNENYLLSERYDKMIARPMYDTLSTKGERIDGDFNLKIGDTVKMNFKVGKNMVFGGKKNPLFGSKDFLYSECKIISSSKEGNKVTLMDGNKSFYDVPRDTFLKEYAKRERIEQKQEKKMQHGKNIMRLDIER